MTVNGGSKRRRLRKDNQLSINNDNDLHAQIYALKGIVSSMRLEIQELNSHQSRIAVRKIVEAIYKEDVEQLTKLRRDTAHILKLLIEAGLISREDLNEVV